MRALLLVLLLAGCVGTAPPVVRPSKALGEVPRCTANDPPPGHTGPVSPHAGPCGQSDTPAVAPAGVHDYSTGMPPRMVR